MRQILQDLRNGQIEVADVPSPQVGRGQVLIRTSRTLISAGTERMMLEFGEANWLNKARQQPDKVRMVVDKIKTDGLVPTYQAVRDKLDSPLALGYCNAGTVIEVGAGVTDFQIGDRVVSNGAHAEVVSVPVNLCAKIPDGVTDDEAVFTVLGAISLQGVRLAQPTFGECFVVTGLGLIGLMTVQLLKANGCRVLGLDFNEERVKLARSFGAEAHCPTDAADLLNHANAFSRGRGVDGVLVAAATDSNEPLLQAAQMCRKKGRVVLIGVTGMEISRTEFFKKELSFQVSCSYGPGRYDTAYEEQGIDYPLAYVRWTEQRNFEAVLDSMASQALNVLPFISHRFKIESAAAAYEVIKSGTGSGSLGVLLEYPETPDLRRTLAPANKNLDLLRTSTSNGAGANASVTAGAVPSHAPAPFACSFIGAGNYATRVLIPAFKEAGADLRSVITSRGATSMHAARKFGFKLASTDMSEAWKSENGNTVVIATRHSSHSRLVCEAFVQGKHVFVEKPLAVTLEQVNEIERTFTALPAGARPLLMVGFNRRFSPLVARMMELLRPMKAPKSLVMTVNAGQIPGDHWTQSIIEGRRLIGEGCHFIDLMRYLAGAPIRDFSVQSMEPAGGQGNREDCFVLTLRFEDGSIGTIQYLSNGHRSFPKERLEVFCQGHVLQIDNFKKLEGYGFPNFSKLKLWSQDKGQAACAQAFSDAITKGLPAPIPFDEIMEVARISIRAAETLR